MADFDYNKTYGPEDGAFVVDHPGGSVTVPSGKVLQFEMRPVAVIADPPAKTASVTPKSVKARATTKSAKKKGSK